MSEQHERAPLSSAARLAEIRALVAKGPLMDGDMWRDLLAEHDRQAAEVERLRAALADKTDSYERLHLINGLIVSSSRWREEAMEIVRAVADAHSVTVFPMTAKVLMSNKHDMEQLRQQARALLAADDESEE